MTEKKKRGFAAMTAKERFAAQSKGGKNAHANGTAYQWDSVTASTAGTRGGRNNAARRATSGIVPVSSELVSETPSPVRLRDNGDGPESPPDRSGGDASAA